MRKKNLIDEKMEQFFHTPSGKWDNRTIFRVNDIHEMTGLPISTITLMLRDGVIRGAKRGRAWLVEAYDLYDWWQREKDASTII